MMYDEKLPSPPSSGDCGSVVIGIEPVNKSLMIQFPLWALINVMCCFLQQETYFFPFIHTDLVKPADNLIKIQISTIE